MPDIPTFLHHHPMELERNGSLMETPPDIHPIATPAVVMSCRPLALLLRLVTCPSPVRRLASGRTTFFTSQSFWSVLQMRQQERAGRQCLAIQAPVFLWPRLGLAPASSCVHSSASVCIGQHSEGPFSALSAHHPKAHHFVPVTELTFGENLFSQLPTRRWLLVHFYHSTIFTG